MRRKIWVILCGVLAALALVSCQKQPGAGHTDPAEPWTEADTDAAAPAAVLPTRAETASAGTEPEASREETEEPPEDSEEEPDTTEEPELFIYKGLVELKTVDDRFLIEQRYATENNYTGRAQYDRELLLVHEDILPLLTRAADLAKSQGCRIKIWDAYRPVSVQQALHDSAPPELAIYVPAPGPWSMHARGITVDVTLCDRQGNELDMPTGFDDFSYLAHSDSTYATQQQIANRELLNQIMTEAGFTRSKLEWWHFDGPNRENYQVLDVSFADYEAARKKVQ